MRRDLLLFGCTAAAAALAAGLALRHGTGTLDDATTPPPATGKAAPRRILPGLVVPAGFPDDAAALLREVWETAGRGTESEAAAAVARLVPRGKGGVLDGCAPAALEAMAPSLEALILSDDPGLAGNAMRAATALARHGGKAGKEVLARTGLVEKAFAPQAAAGPEELRVETARNLGAVGGRAAVEWLVLLLTKAPEVPVRTAAVEALAAAHVADGRIPSEAAMAVRACMEGKELPPALRQACIRTFDRAWASFKGLEVGPLVAAAVGAPEPAVRLAAVGFFVNHPLDVGGEALVKVVGDSDPRIVEAAANALAEIRPSGARDALLRRRETLTDADALRAVDRALLRCR